MSSTPVSNRDPQVFVSKYSDQTWWADCWRCELLSAPWWELAHPDFPSAAAAGDAAREHIRTHHTMG